MLWLPESAQNDMLNAERDEAVDKTLIEQVGLAKRLTSELRSIDPSLEIVWVGERAEIWGGMTPGRWHIRRTDNTGLDHYLPITNPDGSYKELSMSLIEELKKADLWNEKRMKDLTAEYERQRKAAERAKETEAEARKEQMASSFRAAKRVSGEGGMHKRLWGKK